MDRDLDGIPLLMEFYMGLAPDLFDDEIEPGETTSTLTFRLSKDANNVTLTLLYSDEDMASWKAIGHSIRVLEDQSSWERIGADIDLGFGVQDRLFFQLQVDR